LALSTLAVIGAEETIWTAAGVLRSWIEQYGVPVALYTDWKTVYVKEATEQQLLRGEAAAQPDLGSGDNTSGG
jgi:hypothetical protein